MLLSVVFLKLFVLRVLVWVCAELTLPVSRASWPVLA